MKIVLTGGGTGGHIYPALAIGRYCQRQRPGTELHYIGSETGLEKEIVGKEGIPFESIHISGFRRKLSAENLKTVWRFLKAVSRSRQLLKRYKPDVVVGTGGYVCGPVIYAAAKLGIPTLIHEQNVVPGLTNKFLSRYASTIAVSFPGSESNFPRARRAVYTGNPRATEVVNADPKEGWNRFGLPERTPLVVMVGGSRGARALNESMVDLTRFLNQFENVHFLYVTGKPYYEDTVRRIEDMHGEIPEQLTIVPYADRFPEVLAASSLVISRSGASSIAEITALGIPSIQIPSPNVTNNHQEANARQLVNEGAAEMILERDLEGEALYRKIQSIIQDPIRKEYMSNQAKKLGRPDASRAIYDELAALIGRS